jgi:hypothetical protein
MMTAISLPSLDGFGHAIQFDDLIALARCCLQAWSVVDRDLASDVADKFSPLEGAGRIGGTFSDMLSVRHHTRSI